jgi:DNA-binding XRE family transcriptional regulator
MSDQPSPLNLDDLHAYLREADPECSKSIGQYDFGYEVARLLLTTRRERQLTQDDVATMAGMTQQQIADIERLKANPTALTVTKLCNALDVTFRLDHAQAW